MNRMTGLSLALTLSAAVSLSAMNTAQAANQLDASQVKQVQSIVHDYIVKNPEVLVEASRSLQEKTQKMMQEKAQKAIAKNAQQIFFSKTSPVLGDTNSNISVVEFYDYQCSHCKEEAPIMKKIMKANPKVRFVFKELPIFGPSSEYAAKASMASVKQGKYAAFHEALLASDKRLTNKEVMKIAAIAGLNTEQLKKDMKNPAYDEEIKANFKLAQEIGMPGTPAFIIGNKKGNTFVFIPGTAGEDKLQQAIKTVTNQ